MTPPAGILSVHRPEEEGSSRPRRGQPRLRARFADLSFQPRHVALIVAGLLLLLRGSVLDQRPVWDGAMGMTPAAITLEKTDFDIAGLLSQPDYKAGGPNTHALSLVTMLTAAAIRAFGSYEAALPTLHLANFALAGLVAAGVYRLVQPLGGRRVGLLAAAIGLLYPPMLVQASDVYLDLALATASLWAVVYLAEDLWKPAIALAVVAAWIKPTAFVLVPFFAWVVMRQGPHRVRRLATLTVPALMAVAPLLFKQAVKLRLEAGADFAHSTGRITLTYAGRTLMILVLLASAAVTGLIAMSRTDPASIPKRARVVLMAAMALPATHFLLFIAAPPIVSRGFVGLPRYTTMFSSLLVAALAVSLVLAAPKRSTLVLGLVGVLFSLNLWGLLDSPAANLYPLSERSLEYEGHVAVQEAALKSFEALAQQMPVFYDHHTHFRFEYPEEGWTSSYPISGTPVYITDGLVTDDLAGYPDRFAMLIEAPWLGGELLTRILSTAQDDPAWDVTIESFEDGTFRNDVIVLGRVDP